MKVKYDSDNFMVLPKLFHLFTVYGRNELLKSSVLTLKFGKKKEKHVVWCSGGLEMRSFKYWGKRFDFILKK